MGKRPNVAPHLLIFVDVTHCKAVGGFDGLSIPTISIPANLPVFPTQPQQNRDSYANRPSRQILDMGSVFLLWLAA